MPSAAVVAAVEARLDANFTAAPRREVNGDGTFAVPGDGSPFLILPLWVSEEEPITIGAPGFNTVRESGAFHIVLYTKVGSGIATARTQIDQLKAIFRQQQFAGITVLSIGADVIGNSSSRGMYFDSSFAVTYEYFFAA